MKRMLFNATHHEEIRVAIIDGQKLVDLDIETSGREQRKGNIYKGLVTRIEPGLEACFINYGEDKHGFLPFKEIARSYFKEGIDFRNTRIQDAIKEGQELIVQVEKEERGNKGAALTTFISLAGRYLVLMPNNPRGGGVSRRIEGEERQELKEIIEELDVPHGMSIIARTAGISRSIEELQWDLSYLLQLWNAIDQASKENNSPVLIYLESSLVIRAIRDYFSPDINEILIDNQEIVKQAIAFMSVVMPDNVQRVKFYQNEIPLFSRFQIEHQIETAYSRMIQLPSGGSIIIDHTEALVAIDVNSAKSTRGADIEETALRTNLEAAEEVARQLRLRDLGGLLVIDFIDMEDTKNQRNLEQKLREALRVDRARVQMGKISKFGLIELSRQRLRPALNEGSHITCPRCTGIGVIRDTESCSLQVLRLIQEEAMKDGTSAVYAQVPIDVATYLSNEKRNDINNIEARLNIKLVLVPNKYIETPHYNIERVKNDDSKLEETRVSFNLVEIPNNNQSWKNSSENEEKQKPEALVKGRTPSKPAPIVSNLKYKNKKNIENSKVNPIRTLLTKILSWVGFSSENNDDIYNNLQKNKNNTITPIQNSFKSSKSEKKYNIKNKNQSKLLQEKQNEQNISLSNTQTSKNTHNLLNNIKNDSNQKNNDALISMQKSQDEKNTSTISTHQITKKDKIKNKRSNNNELTNESIANTDENIIKTIEMPTINISARDNSENDKKSNYRRRNANSHRKNQKEQHSSKTSTNYFTTNELSNINNEDLSNITTRNVLEDIHKDDSQINSNHKIFNDNYDSAKDKNDDTKNKITKHNSVSLIQNSNIQTNNKNKLQLIETNYKKESENNNEIINIGRPDYNKNINKVNTKQLKQIETKT
ncbi:ribonuclease E [Candidatus Kinetoplastibacterium desouzaii TCC079E]|uniref:Ribonuclease E n=1 Tax=Candidatus Kinetoplastidibacterium desouzai TCC079E TaxID=1208919 RepID=M1LUN2_9PROT|nr:Rne/Rng family ribonuclease [Candidatus Kinetoplastibacterium desouzaii]AGF47019.1 ribonuclease E [Candidatus Kinetoplastibacterium desouzaii TCC079E]